VVEPPGDAAPSDFPTWPWIAAGVGGLGALGFLAARLRRRRGRDTMSPPGTAPEAP